MIYVYYDGADVKEKIKNLFTVVWFRVNKKLFYSP